MSQLQRSDMQVEEARELALPGTMLPDFVGDSNAARAVRQLTRRVAPNDTSVLILGESGTGKEIIARQLHAQSSRAGGPFVPVNCGAIPADLLESELFGHEKGAFTGALSARRGRFERAAGGTLFLDEIGDMPLPMQVKLLRVLQERCYERVGSAISRNCDVRIVAATHQDLEARVERGEFRADLYYRLNVFPIDIPSLRERCEDVPLLLRHFSSKLPESGLREVYFDREAISALRAYDWPGNVRELANFVERMAILHGGVGVGVSQLPPRFVGGDCEVDAEAVLFGEAPREYAQDDSVEDGTLAPAASSMGDISAEVDFGNDLKAYLGEVERKMLLQALEDANWVVARAAKRLNLRRTTMVEKMRKFAIQRELQVSES
ncbi:MAG: sigma-54 interaction domain-containing protein [Parahaliea sp.]